MTGAVRRWARRLLVVAVVGTPLAAASLFVGIEVTSQPRFCGTCHYMQPYYRSWQTSTHKNVACVECHIPPGITSEFRKKYEALAMVARYFTGTYSTNPWTEVDDKSCLRSGCHEKRVLLGKELFKGILFDHQPHLGGMRRGKVLRCTSCHSQIVQGSHISVTASTCFLCHFKNTPLNTGTARCALCHEVPVKTITTAGLSFDHGDVKRFDMNCVLCHQGVVKGDGDVPRERCYTCHNDPSRLNRYGETEFLHRMHVTEHKVECLNCHIEIVHKIPAREETLAAECRSCHSPAAGHSAVRDLYRGLGGKNVAPQPAAMYLAGVRCEACHTVRHTPNAQASELSCMSCHGPRYLTVFRTWRAGLDARLQGVRTALDALRDTPRQGAAAAALAEAADNFALVDQGKGMHNPRYSVALLERSLQDVQTARTALGMPALTERPWLQAPYESECLRCHFGVEYLSRPAFGRDFPHARHVVAARLRCTICHTPSAQHGGTRLTAKDCDDCHTRTAKPMGDMPADQCLHCHTAAIGKVSEKVNFPHDKHIDAGLECAMCHAGVTDTAHRDFAHSARALPPLGHEFCASCHAADVPATDGTPPEGADCTKCHAEF